ncbi:hypothetical protein C8R44DRAFT_335341 [Mycena epipterygia]|nr:hypothetical protein C8R44DRAFT_335341 [Mycena epipterygia]
MNVDEHGDEVPVPPVVRDLTKPQVKKGQTSQTTKFSAKDTPEVLDSPPPRPKKLANGNYKCNHPCKDKTKCRHMCCRDGLAEPPKQPKKRVGQSDDSKIQCSPVASPIQPKKPTKTIARPDSTMKDLERLHERTNVNLKLPESGRLKLEPTKRKHRPVIDFNVELTQLSDEEPTVSYHIAELDDDDDLPEPHELLKPAKSTEASSETNYSDSEMDSLIRHVPSDLTHEVTKNAAQRMPKSPKQDKTRGVVRKPQLLTPLPSRKRNQISEEILPPPKRSRFDFGSRPGLAASPAGRPERTKV